MKPLIATLVMAVISSLLCSQLSGAERAILKNDTSHTLQFYSQWSDQSQASELSSLAPGQTVTLVGNANAQLVLKYNATP